MHLGPDQFYLAASEATFRSAHVIGLILRKVYRQRRISTRLAQELANECKQWPENLTPALHWRRASPNNRRQAMAILHSNLAYCHSIILLSRPFFLYLLSSEVQRRNLGNGQQAPRIGTRMQKFSNACFIASIHTVALIQTAHEGRYLPGLNSPVTYTLLEAALVIFANEFVRPSANPLSGQCMNNAITIMSYCGVMDPQAKRAAHVLVEFRKLIRREEQASQPLTSIFQTPLPTPAQTLSDQNNFTPVLESGFTPIPPSAGAGPFSIPDSLAAPANNFIPSTSNPPEDPLSGLLDLNNTVLPTLSDPESSGPDEFIDFDGLWGWPDITPSPEYGAPGSGPEQSDIAIP